MAECEFLIRAAASYELQIFVYGKREEWVHNMYQTRSEKFRRRYIQSTVSIPPSFKRKTDLGVRYKFAFPRRVSSNCVNSEEGDMF
ncbi:hypothetical protein ACTXT7_000039 [Hymenolepis weldensis]